MRARVVGSETRGLVRCCCGLLVMPRYKRDLGVFGAFLADAGGSRRSSDRCHDPS
jgi:hypothetical protein